jgi:hypothetical protein
MLLDGASNLKKQGIELIVAAKQVLTQPTNQSNKEQLELVIQDVIVTLENIAAAARIVPYLLQKLKETYEYVQKLMELTVALSNAMRSLSQKIASGASNEEIQLTIKRISDLINSIIEQVSFISLKQN